MEEIEAPPVLTGRARKALASTRRWAAFAGFAFLSAGLLALIRIGAGVFDLIGNSGSGVVPHAMFVALLAGFAVSAAWLIAANGALGWFALLYASALERIRLVERPPDAGVTAALRAQHRFWRLQGILYVAVIVLAVLVVIAGVVAAAAVHR